MEECFWSALEVIRRGLEREKEMVAMLAGRLVQARQRLDEKAPKPRDKAPNIEALYQVAADGAGETPKELRLSPNGVTTLRAQLGKVLNYYNTASGGAVLVSAADLLGSTSVDAAAEGSPAGWYHAVSNPDSRRLALGGICEDAMAGILGGLSSYGRHVGVASSYGAFIAPLGHVAARLHAIGNQARWSLAMESYKPMILVCAHAGLKTGEDGPTHADPQPLQLLQENFPRGTAITLTPWEPQEIWPLLTAALGQRPALIAPFVTRPNEVVPEREGRGLAPASAATQGVYRLRSAKNCADGALVLQGSEVTLVFVDETLPRLEEEGIDLDVYYVASAELFDLLPEEERERIFPDAMAREAMGITGFTLPTMYRWVRSERGRKMSLHPFRKGHFLGSGPGEKVLQEAGLDADGQYSAIKAFLSK
jgi:transketolase